MAMEVEVVYLQDNRYASPKFCDTSETFTLKYYN